MYFGIHIYEKINRNLNSENRNWWIYFEIVPWGVADPNHPTWNKEKEMGQIPYDRFSTTAEFRKLDYKAEKEEKT